MVQLRRASHQDFEAEMFSLNLQTIEIDPSVPCRAPRIPNRYHFIWFGNDFPTTNRIAIESCVRHCSGSEVILWHADELSKNREFRSLSRLGVRTRRMSPNVWFPNDAPDLPFDAPRLNRIWHQVESHVSRSNLARAAALYYHGGVYLDMDVLVVRNLEPLLTHPAFVGKEHLVWPECARRGASLQRYVKSPILDLWRRVSASVPGGERLFLGAAPLYPQAVNGAILGARAAHPFLATLLQATAEVPNDEWAVKHRLGTHVLQRCVRGYHEDDLAVLPPEALYPLGPEVSRQYFRYRRDPRPDSVMSAATFAVHWYASVSDLSRFGPVELAALSERTIFGRLCAPYLESEPQPERGRVLATPFFTWSG